jgi:hypothetical protein
MKSSLLWAVTQCKLVVSDVSLQPSSHIFIGQAEDSLTPDDDADRLSRNVGN